MSYKISRKSKINDTTSSTSKTTGALQVVGGISSEENLNVGGFIGITGTTNTVSIKVQPSTNAYNYNLPTTSGSSGEILTSAGGNTSPMTWTSTTGSGSIVLSSGPTFGVGGLTSTAGTTTLGATTIGAITGTSASFSTTLNTTGLATFGAGGLTSTAGTTTLGATTIGAITGTSASFSTTLNTTGLATFGTGGLTSTAGTTTLGATTIGAITGTSSSFSSSTSSTTKTTGAVTVVGGIATEENLNVGGYIGLSGSTSGIISIKSQAVAGTYNFNLPTTSGSSGQVLTSAGGVGAPMTWSSPAVGTVTSVDLSVPSFLSVSGNPVTSSGTIAVAYSGTALPIANGGTGATTFTLNSVLLGSTSGSIQSPATITYSSSTLTLPKITSNDGTASTSASTGSVLMSGGLGISNTTDATSATNGGSITTAGGLAVEKKAYIGTDLSVGGTTNLGNLTVSTALALDGSKNITSITNTGTGNNVLSASPTITGTLTASAISASGLITASSGLFIPSNSNDQGSTFYIANTNTGSSAYSTIILGNNTASSLNIFLNSSTRTGDGGVNTATIRNDAGSLKLQSTGGGGISITSGLATFDSGLTSTAGTTTLGATTIGVITGTSATFSTTTASTSNTTGSITTAGGLGISNTTDATSTTNGGSITTAGGLAVAKKAFIGNNTDTASINIRSTGGTYQAGSIYSDANWGMIFRSAVDSPSLATFKFGKFDDTALMYMYDSGQMNLLSTTASTSSTTGVFTTPGGISSSNTTDATSTTNGGSITTAGGLAVAKKAFIGTNLTAGSVTISGTNFTDRTISSNVNWGIIFTSDAALGGSFLFASVSATTNYIEINSSKTLRVYGNIGVDSTTASTSNTTGGLTMAGGLGISNTTDATSTTNGGSITTAGGLAVAKKAFIGTDLTAGGTIRNDGGVVTAMNTSETSTGQTSMLIMPMSCQLFSASAAGVSTGVVSPLIGTGGTDFGGLYKNPPAQFDFWRTYINLVAGTYTFRLIYATSADRGIATIVLNGTSIGTLDTYSASSTITIGEITAISVATSGVFKVELQVNTKNGSSSNYYLLWTSASFVRTS
jgi:hypothetical protein